MKKKFLCIGGFIYTTDGSKIYISANKLPELYRVKKSDCIFIKDEKGLRGFKIKDYVLLTPKSNGDYSLVYYKVIDGNLRKYKRIYNPELTPAPGCDLLLRDFTGNIHSANSKNYFLTPKEAYKDFINKTKSRIKTYSEVLQRELDLLKKVERNFDDYLSKK